MHSFAPGTHQFWDFRQTYTRKTLENLDILIHHKS